MALGKLKWVENLDSRLGTDDNYWLLKVQADYSSSTEEYWLVTAEERSEFQVRASKNPEDDFDAKMGVHTTVQNTHRKVASEALAYSGIKVRSKDGTETWFLTDHDLERIRQRVERRKATLEANASSWLADLFD